MGHRDMFEREAPRIPYALMLALLLSALLHLALLMQFPPRLKFESPDPAGLPGLTVQLEAYSPIQLPEARGAPAEISPDGTPTAAPDRRNSGAGPATDSPPAAVSAGQNDLRQPRLNLSLPPMKFPAPPESGTVSGTVFSSQLRSRISDTRQSRSLPQALPSLALGTDAGSYRGGQWETVLRVGDLCFRVIEANPLETLSNEQWFQVDCN